MIITSYSQFRDIFTSSTATDPSGYKRFSNSAIISQSSMNFVGLPSPTDDFPLGSIQSGGEENFDGTYGVDTYHWYLSSRSPNNPILYLSQVSSAGGISYSNRVYINTSSTVDASVEYPFSENELRYLFKDTVLWCYRIADGKIAYVDLEKIMMGPA